MAAEIPSIEESNRRILAGALYVAGKEQLQDIEAACEDLRKEGYDVVLKRTSKEPIATIEALK